MAKIYSGSNPSQLYLEALVDLMRHGDLVAPRGKAVKEIRPVIFEFTNPKTRITYLKGRKVNPFFQQAEALWILAGRADVEWLVNFNKNMAEFSDDGRYFNAAYGQRLRSWNENTMNGFIFNPFDQLQDVYRKLQKDIYTRQAVAVIYNPLFDNSHYEGKDTPCNLILTFKVRDNKLHLTVFNRSNDIHWGVFGANLCQFATIQEVMAAWLGLPVGNYSQITDSLHVYLDDYGAKETNKVFEAYGIKPEDNFSLPVVQNFVYENEPQIAFNNQEFGMFLDYYFGYVDQILQDDEKMSNFEIAHAVMEEVSGTKDPYFRNTLLAMVAYRAHRLGQKGILLESMKRMEESSWKLSCLYFLFNTYKDEAEFAELYADYSDAEKAYIEGR